MKKKSVLLVLSFILLFSFVLLSKYEDRPALRNLDFAVTVKVQERIDKSSHLRTASLIGNLMEGATFFASPEFTVLATFIMTGIAAYDRKKRVWNWKAVIIPTALVILVIIEIYGKSIVHHPSPPFSMIKHPTTIFPANYVNEQFSYPSGHAARAVFIALVLFSAMKQYNNVTMRKRLFIGLGLGIYVGLVSISRIYLGHHWFSDVVGGMFLGGTLGVLTWMSVPTYNTLTMSD